ncbi:hypothetical protein RRG08_018317 [Elysia crispata]|uniref:Uncharacterized protein n=1 Tax=Elysia crispata TaxID=231223 RepID=A0AAE1AYB9_9GAST|nr:hypothetical protein RRG08_018317 [Elysia crispata]
MELLLGSVLPPLLYNQNKLSTCLKQTSKQLDLPRKLSSSLKLKEQGYVGDAYAFGGRSKTNNKCKDSRTILALLD